MAVNSRLAGFRQRARALLRLLQGAPPRRAPSGRADIGGLAASLEVGALDGVIRGVAKGWAWRPDTPHQPTSVDLYVDGRFVGRAQADGFRPDLAESSGGRGMHGFSLPLPLSTLAAGELRAFAASSGLELRGSPRPLHGSPLPRPRPRPRAARALLKLDFSAKRAITAGEQRTAYGRRFDALVETDPLYPEGAWPISRALGYVDALRFGGGAAIGGAARFFDLFDAAAEHFSTTPAGLPIAPSLLAALTSAPQTGAAPTRLVELVVGAMSGLDPARLAPADWGGVALDYLHARRLPLELLGEAMIRRLRDPTELLVALRRVSWLRQAAGSDEALLTAAEALGLLSALRGEAVLPDRLAAEPGVAVISADYGDTGLATNVRRSLEALHSLAVEPDHVAVQMESVGSDHLKLRRTLETVLIHAQPADATELILRLPPDQLDQRLIGFYMWETEAAPTSYGLGLRLVDEVWTGSRFSATALSRRSTSSEVHVVGHAVVAEDADSDFDARGFAGVKAGDFLVYTHFDGGSWITRKNPQAVAHAFRRAFPRGDEPCHLLIKTRGGGRDLTDAVRAAWDELLETAEGDARIRLIDSDLSREQATALMRAADCYVSLHRAEGFGYGPAEALLAGVPLIVSAYSGSLDFTEHAWLTPCRRRPIRKGEFVADGADQYWGEPDIEVAASHMAEIFQDQPSARARAEAARVQAASELSVETLAHRYRARLEAV